MAELKQQDIIRKIRPRNIILPIVIGLIIVAWLVSRELSKESSYVLSFNSRSLLFIGIAVCCMIFRDLGYMIRIRILTENDLTWRKAFRVIMLWEFTSAISPSTIGGTAVAVVFIHKEGLNVGRASSVVLITSFLDELYFVIMFPALFFLMSGEKLFMQNTMMAGRPWYFNELFLIAMVGYSIKLIWVLLVGYGMFFNPRGLSDLIIRVFRLRLLRKWKDAAIRAGDDIVKSSLHFRQKSFVFWFKASLATFLSWSARYWVANAILAAFFNVKGHFLLFARQLIMWIMMLISPTPGGSGIAEIIFSRYLADFIPLEQQHIPGAALAIALIWRAISYYPYLIVGAIIAPGWVNRNFFSKKRGEKVIKKESD